MEKIPLTRSGAVQLEAEMKTLKSVERPTIIKAIAEARELGDLKENAEKAKDAVKKAVEPLRVAAGVQSAFTRILTTAAKH